MVGSAVFLVIAPGFVAGLVPGGSPIGASKLLSWERNLFGLLEAF